MQNCLARIISLVYNIYINKVTKRFNLIETERFLEILLLLAELIKYNREASKKDIKSY
jgi:hypothetical protein